jgi:PEGA domain-containing protein
MPPSSPTTTLFASLCFALALGLASGACAHVSLPAGVALEVDSNVAESTIWVDDVLVGTVAAWAREARHVRAGFHRIEVRAPGYYSVYAEIDQPDGGRAAIKATLRPVIE